jgi:hypothetical protein
MNMLTINPFLAPALGMIGLLMLLVLMRKTPLKDGKCLRCGRRAAPGSDYCPYHESDL